MAIVINGSGSISGISAGGLPDASITADDLASTLDLTGKTVTLPAGVGGKILQVVQATSTSSFSTSSTSYVTTGFSASITPTSSSNKILVFVNGGGLDTWQSSDNTVYMALYRSGSSLGFTDVFGYSSRTIAPISFSYLDSPATTSSTTYTLYLKAGGAYTVYMNSRNETAAITLMEIAA